MKTKKLFLLLTLFVALSVSAQDSAVVINGVRWATRNVAAPGTFATNPEDAGLFYQWNSKVGWPAMGTVSGWNSSWNGGYITPSASDTWTSANDPSPAGYRVPTYAEIKTLLDTTKVTNTWTTVNSVNGRKFTDKTSGNSIFFPASGCRSFYLYGTLDSAGSIGYYWSSTAYNVYNAYDMYLYNSYTDCYYYGRTLGLTIRPVAK
jgi:uncharacterized protein (TIGR02145 family)